jgi:hypothetical protein
MGRRSQGEGSIYKRKKDGLWVAQYLVDTPDGKTKSSNVTLTLGSLGILSTERDCLDYRG